MIYPLDVTLLETAASSGNGLDAFRQALQEIRQQEGPPDCGLLEEAKLQIWDAAVRHLESSIGREVLSAIYLSVMQEPPPKTNAELDRDVLRSDERRADTTEIERLAKLSVIDYEREREAAAKALGCRVTALDDMVNTVHDSGRGAKGQGRPLQLPQIELWPTVVGGAELLGDVAATIRQFVLLSDAAADAVALWSVATHTFDSFEIFPRLTLRSATPRCGKTTLRDVIAGLVAKPLAVDSIMAAALFRTIELEHPTLLLDEADTYLPNNEDLRGIINSGHRRGGAIIRCVGESHEPRQFSTWAPLLVAMIGNPPATIYDRSIMVTMARKKTQEQIEPLRGDGRHRLHALGRKAARWIKDNHSAIKDADPPPVDCLNDRANDNWRCLLAVATIAGDEWKERARNAARTLAETADHDAVSTGEMLISDIRWIFDGRPEERSEEHGQQQPVERISSADLAAQLASIEGRPWADWRKGNPINENALARLLREFKIKPTTLRFGSGVVRKGYRREDFGDVFGRYEGSQTVTPLQTSKNKDLSGPQTVTRDGNVTVGKAQKPNNDADCNDVTVDEGLQVEETLWTV